jgi:hypothetical protein
LWWVGIHCGILKSSYNISNILYLNSSLPPSSFIPPSPHSWNSFNRCHFSIYIHMYTVFVPCSPSFTISLPPPYSHWYQPPISMFIMYYCPIWFTSSIFLLSTLDFFLCWFQSDQKFYIHSCIESTSTIFTFLMSFFYSAPLVCDLP